MRNVCKTLLLFLYRAATAFPKTKKGPGRRKSQSGTDATTPRCNRYVEALCILLEKEGKRMTKDVTTHIVETYNDIANMIMRNRPLEEQSCRIQLPCVNKTIVGNWRQEREAELVAQVSYTRLSYL